MNIAFPSESLEGTLCLWEWGGGIQFMERFCFRGFSKLSGYA